MIRTAMVGLGKMGLSHLAIVRAHPEIDLVAGCDATAYLTDILEKHAGLKCYADFDRMLEAEQLDAIVIATPSKLHAGMVEKALRRNLHVFCEKPFVLDVAEGERLAALAGETSRVTQVGYHFRFVGAFKEAARIVRSGALGTVHHVRAEAYGPVVLRRKGSTWRSAKSEGGGALYDYACHAVDLVNFIVGAPASVDGVVRQSVFSRDVDDEVYATLRFAGGMSGQLSVNWSDESFRKMSTKISVWGTNGRLTADRQECQLFLREAHDGPPRLDKGWTVRYTTDLTEEVWFYLRGEEYSAQIDYFASSILAGRLDGENSFSSALEADRVVAMILADGGAVAPASRPPDSPAKGTVGAHLRVKNDAQREAEFSVHGLFPGYYDGTRVSYSYRALIESMRVPGVAVHAYVLGNGASTRDDVQALLPMAFYRHTSRLLKSPARSLAARFQHRFKPGDVAHIWLHNPPEVHRALQRRGVITVREMVNCTFERCRDVLAHAYAELGERDPNAATDAAIERERAELLAADAVFCPNAFVAESVAAYGVAPERCLRTSYGWSPERLRGGARQVEPCDGTTFLFAGSGSVRKGLPWLLAAWATATTGGRLLIAGQIDAAVRLRHAAVLARDDVIELGHVDDIGAVYRSADVFCFPSWEEGGPMVTIEAMGMGLACIVSPMGSAGILSEQAGGALIVAPGDTAGLASAMRTLASDAALRERLAAQNRALAENYTWARVGARRTEALRALRAEALLGRLPAHGQAAVTTSTR